MSNNMKLAVAIFLIIFSTVGLILAARIKIPQAQDYRPCYGTVEP